MDFFDNLVHINETHATTGLIRGEDAVITHDVMLHDNTTTIQTALQVAVRRSDSHEMLLGADAFEHQVAGLFLQYLCQPSVPGCLRSHLPQLLWRISRVQIAYHGRY